jgi:hypothetical protein
MYKERNQDIFKFGPVWDLDLGFDNNYKTYPVNDRPGWVFEYGNAAKGYRDFVRRLLSDEMLFLQLKDTYIDYRERGVLTKESLLQVIDDYALTLDQSQQMNFMRWNILNKRVHANPQTYGSYEGEVKNVKRYILERLDWMDKKLNYIDVGNSSIPTDYLPVNIDTQPNMICFNRVLTPVLATITDLTGKVWYSASIRENTSVPVSKGFYFITITDATGLSKTVKGLVY